jgi:hypothetical protein
MVPANLTSPMSKNKKKFLSRKSLAVAPVLKPHQVQVEDVRPFQKTWSKSFREEEIT